MANSTAKLEQAFRRDPDSPHFARLADCYLERGHTERALELCQKGCADFPDYTTGFIVLSKCHEKRGDLEQAREAMGQALRLDPANPSGFKRLAHLFEQLGVGPLVLQSLRQAAYLDPFDASLAERIDHFSSRTPAPEEFANGFGELPPPDGPQDAPAPEPAEPQESIAEPQESIAEPQAAPEPVASAPPALPPSQPPADRDELYGDTDDGELLRLLQEIEEEKAAAEPASAPEEPPAPQSKCIATMTLAEIYTTQGLTQKAIETYRALLEQEPTNTIIRSKLASLEQQSSNAH